MHYRIATKILLTVFEQRDSCLAVCEIDNPLQLCHRTFRNVSRESFLPSRMLFRRIESFCWGHVGQVQQNPSVKLSVAFSMRYMLALHFISPASCCCWTHSASEPCWTPTSLQSWTRRTYRSSADIPDEKKQPIILST